MTPAPLLGHVRWFRRAMAGAAVAGATLLGLGVQAAAAAPPLGYPAACTAATGLGMLHPVAVAGVSVGGCRGYLVVDGDGVVSAFGSATAHGDLTQRSHATPAVAIASTPDAGGYWIATAGGGVFSFGDARPLGSNLGRPPLRSPVVALATAPEGAGYWLVTAGGGVLAYGSARSYGSGQHLDSPVVSMAATADGGGYWLVTAFGHVLAFGDARFLGSDFGRPAGALVTALTATPDGGGYWLTTANGRVFAYGDAPFLGSFAGHPPAAPIVAMAVTADDGGGGVAYYLMDARGHVYPFGPAPSFGGASCPVNDAGVYGADPDVMVDTGGGSQLVTVADPAANSLAGTLTAWTRQAGGCWLPVSFAGQPAQPYRAETGYGGIVASADRVGGSGATPEGVFAFGSTLFGVAPSSPNRFYGYRHLVCGDWWDEAPGSPTYDTFQHYPCGVTPPFAYSAEALWTETTAYVHFADIVTPNPPQNSAGIFLHDDTTSGYTAGCVALPPGELDAVLGWLRPGAGPHIAIGTTAVMSSL